MLFNFSNLFFRFPPFRPNGCLSKPRCWIQALTPASGALAGPQPIAPPRPFSCEDVIFLFLSPALPPPSLSLSSFSFLIPLSSPPPLLFSHRYVPLALKGIGFPLWTPPSHFRIPRRSRSSPLPSCVFCADTKCPTVCFSSSSPPFSSDRISCAADVKKRRAPQNDFPLTAK